MTGIDLGPVVLSVKLAAVTVIILLVISTPLAWWLAFTRNRFRVAVEAVTALPLVLPPTVLGFYMLILMAPATVPGSWWVSLTGDTLAFSFTGLVIASVVYSLPFVVQPLLQAFQSVFGQNVVDQSAFSSPGDAGHTNKHAAGNVNRNVL